MIVHANSLHPPSGSTLLLRPWSVILVSGGTIERLCDVALGVANEHDCIVKVLSFRSYTLPLTYDL